MGKSFAGWGVGINSRAADSVDLGSGNQSSALQESRPQLPILCPFRDRVTGRPAAFRHPPFIEPCKLQGSLQHLFSSLDIVGREYMYSVLCNAFLYTLLRVSVVFHVFNRDEFPQGNILCSK